MTALEVDPVPQWKRWRRRIVKTPVRTPDPELQLPLPEAPDMTPGDEQKTIAARFEAFHRAHPEAYACLLAMALADLAEGAQRIGMKDLWERLRKHGRATGDSPYKLNNIFTRCYADLLAAADPRLAARIERRVRKAQ